MSPPSAEAREWHRIIRASVRESLETWLLQAQAGPVTVEALEGILARAAVPILVQLAEPARWNCWPSLQNAGLNTANLPMSRFNLTSEHSRATGFHGKF